MKEDELPTIVSNKFYCRVGDISTRISFGEQIAVGDDTNYHTATVLSTKDAKELAELILKLIAENGAKNVAH